LPVASRPTAISSEVQGTSFDSGTTTLTATRVDKQMSDQEEAGNHEDMEREGLITRFASATDFDVAGEPVTTTSATVYRNGTEADLALKRKSRGRRELQ